jgi:hypothetical protein
MTDVRDPAVIRQDIEETRQELGEAVEALAAKTNIKARAKEKFAAVRQAASEHRAAALAVAAGVLIVVLVARGR